LLLQIRCFFHGPVLTAGPTTTAEFAVVVCALLIMAIGLEYVASRLGETVHRVGASVLTALAGVVTIAVLLGVRMPAMTREPIEASVLNLLLLAYAAPALLVFGLSKIAAGNRSVRYVHALTTAALALGTVYVMLQIRRFFHGPIMISDTSTAEIAVQAAVLFAMAIGLEVLTKRFSNPVHNYGALALTGLAGVLTFALATQRLPNLTGEPVGGTFFNLVMLGYALPAVLIATLSKTVSGRRPRFYVDGLAGFSLILMLMYVSLEIRTLYHGSVLMGMTTQAEQYTYSVAWLLFGVALLSAGLILQSQRARLASAIVIGLTVLKVFFIDMSGLTGVWRALSFMGLGLVLVAIGWFYQRILFPKRTTA
jgi:uncharacterized membrane protein